jgi:hypothetical protein
MNVTTITEQDVISTLIARAKLEGEVAPRAIVIGRTQAERSLTRKVKFALVVSINNETLVDALIAESLTNDLQFTFIGSEANLQGDLEVDYLFFEAKIMLKQ